MPKQLSKTILLSRGRNYRITPKWHIIYLRTIASNVFWAVKHSFSCCARSSFRFVPFKLTQDWTLNDFNLWRKEILTTIKVYEIVLILIYINTDTQTKTHKHKHTNTHTHTHTYIYQSIYLSIYLSICL